MTPLDLPITIIYVHDKWLMPESGASVSTFVVSTPLGKGDSREVRMA